MVMMMKEVTVKNADGAVYRVKVGKLTYGERNAILQKAMRMVMVGADVKGEINYAILEREIVIKAVKSIEPNVRSVEEFIDNLELSEAQKIVSAVFELNPLF